MSRQVERALAPFDALRRWLFQLVGARFNRALVVPRERRVALFGVLLGLTALALTATVPIWMIALGPLILGVPHVVADVRYLLVRPGYHRRVWLVLAVFAAMCSSMWGLGVRGGVISMAVALLFAKCSHARRAVGLLAVAALYAVCHRAGWLADALMVHLHNFIGIFLWWLWRRRLGKAHWAPMAVFAAGTLLILSGQLDAMVLALGGMTAPATHLTFAELDATIAGFAPSQYGLRLVLLYAFAQSVHYTVWLRLVPEEDRPSPTPRSFTRTYRALLQDMGGWVLLAAAVSTAVFAGWAFFNAARARNTYLEIAFFHVYLELVALTLFWAEKDWPTAARDGQREQQRLHA